ncbi:MAG: sulfur carrier protein ThiS [Terrimicrobiaceae bacterium]|nr:sulfur carrier protein ThiS [Terrimicrobiaceae bacterium]
MTIFLNGGPCELHASRTVAELVAELKLPAPTLLIEHNGTALHRSDWPAAALVEGDRIELLRVVAGG